MSYKPGNYRIPITEKEIISLYNEEKDWSKVCTILENKYGAVPNIRVKVNGVICDYEKAQKQLLKREKKSNEGTTIAPNTLIGYNCYRSDDKAGYVLVKRYYGKYNDENSVITINNNNIMLDKQEIAVKTNDLSNEILNNMREYSKYGTKIGKKDAKVVASWRRYLKVYDDANKYLSSEQLKIHKSNRIKPVMAPEHGSFVYGILSPKMIGHMNILSDVRDVNSTSSEQQDFDIRLSVLKDRISIEKENYGELPLQRENVLKKTK